MTWTKLAYGTAVLSALTLGTAIYYDSASRNQVKTEDIVELLEAVAERNLALGTAPATNTIVWSNVVWTAGSNTYWVDNGTTNGGSTNYLAFSSWVVQSNRFVASGQWFRAWSAITTQVGRIREPLSTEYTVSGFLQGTTTSHIYDGIYAFRNRTTNAVGVSEYVWVHAVSNNLHLANTPQNGSYAWQLTGAGILPIYTHRANLLGGSMRPESWRNLAGTRHSVQCVPTGSELTTWPEISTNTIVTNQVVVTNAVAIYPLEYPARSLTNVANAVSLYDRRALLDAVDAAIGNTTGLITNYVDLSQESNGTFNAWFSANTNTSLLPALTLRRAFQLLGPEVGTNVVSMVGSNSVTNAYWLSYPARGTNAALYGTNVVMVTKEVLTARYWVLTLMTAGQRPLSWGESRFSNRDATYYYDSFTGSVPYTLYATGFPDQAWTSLAGLTPSVSADLTLILDGIHYPPDAWPPEWYHTPMQIAYAHENQARLKSAPLTFPILEAHGYIRRRATETFVATNVTFNGTNLTSGFISGNDYGDSIFGFDGMSVSSSNAPYGTWMEPGYSGFYYSTNKHYSQTVQAGPALIRWDFTRCVETP